VPNAPSFTTNNVRSLDELRTWLATSREEILEPALPIVDPHHHLRETAHGRYLLPELGDDLASGHNIRATVFVDSQTLHRTTGPAVLAPGRRNRIRAAEPRHGNARELPRGIHAPASSAISISLSAQRCAKHWRRISPPVKAASAASAIR
jgi:hypothetical protein